MKDNVFKFISDEQYNLWLLDDNPEKVILFNYSEGNHKNSDEVLDFVNEMWLQREKVAIICIKYYGTSLKYNENAISKLEEKLPLFLAHIEKYLSSRHRSMLRTGEYQKVLDDLYFMEYFDYGVDSTTVIPFFGVGEYNDFGVLAAISLIYKINEIKELYPHWPWNNFIAVGQHYGAYLSEMIEKIKPYTFSVILNKNCLLYPLRDDLFMNYTEWQAGRNRIYIKKMLGKLVLPLIDEYGWTTNMDHEFAFKQKHFDVRNNLNDAYWNRNLNNKMCLRVYAYNETNLRVGKDIKMLLEKLKSKGYSIIETEECSMFELYTNFYRKVIFESKKMDESYVLTSEGMYVFSNLLTNPSTYFINSDEDLECNFKIGEEELNSILREDPIYLELVSTNNK